MAISFRNLFRQEGVSHIEIPIIQRDYAQGRKDVGVTRIRNLFLKVLRDAVTIGKEVGLDFVYGEVKNGRLIPLDGQQRLTTLFLLHWYIAARSGATGGDCDFLGKFTYKTRFSSRHFCEKLVAHRPIFPLVALEWKHGQRCLSSWITDQHWYAGAWKHDPTIQAMLVTLDDIHDMFATSDVTDCRVAWDRLLAEDCPVITFDYLSLEEMGLSDELYIKMNSRGKPLTHFEHFKADFEKTLGEVADDVRREFVRKIDQEWSDLLWPLRNSDYDQGDGNNIIDDEFLRLFHFIGDIVVDIHGLAVEPSLFNDDIDTWAESIYGMKNGKDSLAAQRYMISALDCFYLEFGKMKNASDIACWFEEYFTESDYRQGAVAIFGDVNLFGACCAGYGSLQGDSRRAFTLSRILMLFAVLEYLKLTPRPERGVIAQRLRTLRNLVFASDDEIRLKNFPSLLKETGEYIGSGDRSTLKTYNTRQVAEEELKEKLTAKHPDYPGLKETLHRLEDHSLLRGCLAAFDLDVDVEIFIHRAEQFHLIFPTNDNPPFVKISAALLASGDYSQRPRNDDRFQFGSPERARVWLELMTGRDIIKTKQALMKLLDEFGKTSGSSVECRLQAIVNNFLTQQLVAKKLDWRYYMVKYPKMRSGPSGLFVSSTYAMGFDLCMMKERQFNGKYWDPYLLAIIVQSGAEIDRDVVDLKHLGWDCYKPQNRWIELARTGERVMSCREEGFELMAPSDSIELITFNAICNKHNVGDDLMLRVPQVADGGANFDQEDRINIAALMLKELIAEQHLISPRETGEALRA